MAEYLKQGKYSDFTVIFNGKEFKTHIDILIDNFKYFESLDLKGSNICEISFKKLNGKDMDPIYFEYLRNIIYDDKINDNIFKNQSISDLIDFHRLVEYMHCKKKLNQYKEADDEDSDIGDYLYDKMWEKLDDMPSNIKFTEDIHNLNILCDDMDKKICVELFDIDVDLTCQYTAYLLEYLNKEHDSYYATVRKVFGITNFELPPINDRTLIKYTEQLSYILNIFSAEYYEYIFAVLSMRK